MEKKLVLAVFEFRFRSINNTRDYTKSRWKFFRKKSAILIKKQKQKQAKHRSKMHKSSNAIFKNEIPEYLKRRQLLRIELLNIVVSIEALINGAEVSRLKTTLDPVPVLWIVDSLLQPIRIITKPVLLVASTR